MSMENKNDTYHQDVIDEDLYEEFDDEELIELVAEAKEEALQKERDRKQKNKRPKSPFPKWIFWLIAIAMMMNVIALLPQSVSIPAIDFLKTSAALSTQDNIKTYKQSVVVIETDEGRGTGFTFTENGD